MKLINRTKTVGSILSQFSTIIKDLEALAKDQANQRQVALTSAAALLSKADTNKAETDRALAAADKIKNLIAA
jgi:hypothetical protein